MHRVYLLLLLSPACAFAGETPTAFFAAHCVACHDADTRKGNLDLTALKAEFSSVENFAAWVRVHDRIESGEMPPTKQARPPADSTAATLKWLREGLSKAERERLAGEARTPVRRLTRSEYENTVRDLFDMPGIALQNDLPADGSAHGFDKNSDALDISHVNLSKYIDAAEHVLDYAVATQPNAPAVKSQRIPLSTPGSGVAHVMLHGDAVMLKDKKPDTVFPPAGETQHIDQGAHEALNMFHTTNAVGLFRHEDESFQPYFLDFAALYPGRYRIRTSLWSFQWDKGRVLPSRGTEAARLSVVQLSHDGRHTGHPSFVVGYYDAPSIDSQVTELVQWLNYKETIGFNAASLARGANTRGKGRLAAFTGPGIACDWLDIEGPLNEAWPPHAHKVLFGEMALVEFRAAETPGVKAPKRKPLRQEIVHVTNRPDPVAGIWTVKSDHPEADAERLFAAFLPKAFRRPVSAEVLKSYVAKVTEQLKAGECFETAMRWAYRAALCSPDFLYTLEGTARDPARISAHALAARLSYFLWNSLPDDALRAQADAGTLHDPAVLRGEAERLLKDPRSQRFIEDFLGQWLKLRQIAANDPDPKLYPEFNPYLQDSMVAESRAYFRELIEKDLGAAYLVKSDFAMLNGRLAAHYGIAGVSGTQIRRVTLPADCPRGGFLTQGAILKVTANGTTTSPVPRGAFVLDRLLGEPPQPPPASVPAVEPDVRGTTTIREQLAKHRENAGCAVCHAKIDPPGFALESFDVIGGFRTRYRSIGKGDAAPRGNIDPFIGIGFKLGPPVDAAGETSDGRKFSGIVEMQNLLAAQPEKLLNNLARQLAVYSTGREVLFADRDEINAVVARTRKASGGIRTLILELIQSALFRAR